MSGVRPLIKRREIGLVEKSSKFGANFCHLTQLADNSNIFLNPDDFSKNEKWKEFSHKC
jgi:hypothetical protein